MKDKARCACWPAPVRALPRESEAAPRRRARAAGWRVEAASTAAIADYIAGADRPIARTEEYQRLFDPTLRV